MGLVKPPKLVDRSHDHVDLEASHAPSVLLSGRRALLSGRSQIAGQMWEATVSKHILHTHFHEDCSKQAHTPKGPVGVLATPSIFPDRILLLVKVDSTSETRAWEKALAQIMERNHKVLRLRARTAIDLRTGTGVDGARAGAEAS
ncbi:hypothetical protein MSAN_00438300 [Mycena sanguinolenta]|uniref:Uncharacterized protein n=1 Tax=Mycena sanguinolenta TaxID=230812 RepID=A0A8H6ZAU2_9AGAR|nr:hypothetical protein MSAN_00438300 [Mycena sanguinolenta]